MFYSSNLQTYARKIIAKFTISLAGSESCTGILMCKLLFYANWWRPGLCNIRGTPISNDRILFQVSSRMMSTRIINKKFVPRLSTSSFVAQKISLLNITYYFGKNAKLWRFSLENSIKAVRNSRTIDISTWSKIISTQSTSVTQAKKKQKKWI